MYEFNNLEKVNIDDLTNTWNLAFSDYIIPMSMTPEGLEAYFKVSGVDKNQSFGAFLNGTLVGMILNSVDTFRGSIVAYDAFTGNVPEHRGKGLFSQLFEYTKEHLKSSGITHYYLEVITTNEKAYSIYKKKGGRICREFSVIAGKMNNKFHSDAEIEILPLSNFPKEELSIYEPSFGNRISALHRNIKDYQVAYIEVGDRKLAAVFNTHGRIHQIMFNGPNDNDLLCAVFTHLSRIFEELRISNIPISENCLIEQLLKIGFRIMVNQYEICIEL
jgi:ribosomal protein S18 acetylase RimI-like enzyme